MPVPHRLLFLAHPEPGSMPEYPMPGDHDLDPLGGDRSSTAVEILIARAQSDALLGAELWLVVTKDQRALPLLQLRTSARSGGAHLVSAVPSIGECAADGSRWVYGAVSSTIANVDLVAAGGDGVAELLMPATASPRFLVGRTSSRDAATLILTDVLGVRHELPLGTFDF